jgi:hypothetical protein
MQTLQWPIIIARGDLTDESAFGRYCLAEVRFQLSRPAKRLIRSLILFTRNGAVAPGRHSSAVFGRER